MLLDPRTQLCNVFEFCCRAQFAQRFHVALCYQFPLGSFSRTSSQIPSSSRGFSLKRDVIGRVAVYMLTIRDFHHASITAELFQHRLYIVPSAILRLTQSHDFYEVTVITGSIARSANLPVFSLLRGRFWGLSPRRGDTLHRLQRQGCRTPKIEIFTQIWPKCGI